MGRAALAIIAALALALAGVTLWGSLERSGRLAALAARDACQQASQAAKQAQDQLRAKERAEVKENAAHADQEHAAARPRVLAANDAYAGAHRVRAESDRSAPVAVSSPDSAGVRESVPADSLVAVSEADLQACSLATEYAVSLREWAISATR